MIKLENISKIYTHKKIKTKALDSISLQIEEGEMVAVMGPSGSGKSTLLNILGGLFSPTSGEYYFNSSLIQGSETFFADFRLNNIGFILQNFALIENRDIMFNISLPLKYKNIDKKTMDSMVIEVSKTLGIEDKLKMFPSMLSGGECQRVAIARAIISNPKIILADEPTSFLDDENKYEILNILKKLNDKGITIILATHDKSAAQACNKMILIKNGKIISDTL